MQLHLSIILAALVEGARDKRGAEWCRKWGIGYARRRIGTPVRNVAATAAGAEDSLSFEQRVKAAGELKAWCQACGRCKMARE